MIDPLPSLRKLRDIYEKIDKAKKNHIKLSITILMLSMGLFFYFVSDNQALARKNEELLKVAPETIDPLYKIGKGLQMVECAKNSSCAKEILAPTHIVEVDNSILAETVGDSPMAEMVPALKQRSKEVSAYLVAIAKKESDWGKHSPKKGGKECFNYWGYRGKEDTTDSGYSCFDSPDHAVSVVGDRIEKLLDQNIKTPAQMVVWKCGRDCEAAGGQAAANKWISDVKRYYDKLNS
ncbi:MAG: hypothetical protein UT50_C0002G0028 [Candidatus Moranbacteria bacterium GW2011_GWA2_39_41]|nr:MAG: hypothetical protein UT50_C0002G0028 [Candidatus Moranbacteria bacterium GW2011_GWA2_39_41]